MKAKLWYALGTTVFIIAGLTFALFPGSASETAIRVLGASLVIEGAVYGLKLYKEFKGRKVFNKLTEEE